MLGAPSLASCAAHVRLAHCMLSFQEITGCKCSCPFQEVVLAAQLRLEESRKEHTDLMEAIRKLRRTLQELQDQKAELESQVDLLQSRSQRLQKRIRCVC